MKYIVLQVKRDGEPFLNVPIIFPDLLVHSMVAGQMSALLEIQYFANGKVTKATPISAGSCSSMDMGSMDGMCHGESESLGVKSRGAEDDRLIVMTDYGSGMSML